MLKVIRQRLKALNYKRLTLRAQRRAVKLGWPGLRGLALVLGPQVPRKAVAHLPAMCPTFGIACQEASPQAATPAQTLRVHVEPDTAAPPPTGRFALMLTSGWSARASVDAMRPWLNAATWIWAPDLDTVRELDQAGWGAAKVHLLPAPDLTSSLPGAEMFVDARAMSQFYLGRFLLSQMVIGFDAFWQHGAPTMKPLPQWLGLGVLEYPARLDSFMQEGLAGVQYFPGLRHNTGWIGCGMSYKFLIKLAMRDGLDWVFICEDDVQLPANWREVLAPFTTGPVPAQWAGVDIFSGLITDLPDDTRLLGQWHEGGVHYAVLDQMTGMVCNVYRRGVFDYISRWDERLLDLKNNAIDRYIPRKPALEIALSVPFLAGHKEGLSSTLWKGASNAIYINRFEKVIAQVNRLTASRGAAR